MHKERTFNISAQHQNLEFWVGEWVSGWAGESYYGGEGAHNDKGQFVEGYRTRTPLEYYTTYSLYYMKMAGKGQITCKRASSQEVIGRGGHREHPNQHFVLLLRKKYGKKYGKKSTEKKVRGKKYGKKVRENTWKKVRGKVT